MLLSFFIYLSMLCSTFGQTHRTYNFQISNGKIAPDGFTRDAVLVNNQFPAPLITGNKGDTFEVVVTNNLTNTKIDVYTAIHWHGLFQSNTTHEDGPAGITQCSILPGNTYTYRYKVPNQAGTFWYHSHHMAQYVDGLKGAMVIYDPNDPHRSLYDIDDETTILQLSDWYHRFSHDLVEELFTTGKEPVPQSGLINSLGGKQGFHTLQVVKGKRYRLRLINTSAMMTFRFSIDEHDFTVIEADGINHYPVKAKSLEIYPGQRYSIILNANQNIANYFIRTKMINGPSGIETHGIIRYKGASSRFPKSKEWGGKDRLKEENLSPLEFDKELMDPTVKADITFNLKFTETVNDSTEHTVWTFNDIAYKTPVKPTLYSILQDNATNSEDFPRDSHVLVINKKNAIVDLVIEGSAGGFKHPFHLHGHVFTIISMADKGDVKKKRGPPMRDVHHIGGSREILRFRADNAGAWFFHCHIDWHLEQGLAVVFVEHPELIRQEVKPSLEWFQTCEKWFNFQGNDRRLT